MTSFKINLTVVGAFVLAALVTLVLVLAVLAGRTGPTDTYYAEYANVSGLKFGSQVLFEGYPIGQVEQVQPMNTGGKARFQVELSVTRGWQIPEDSIARSTSSGVLAPQNIAISAGLSAAMLAPGATIRSASSASLQESFSSIAGSVDNLTDQALLPMVDNLNRQITQLGGIIDKDMGPLVKNANRFMAATAEHWPVIMRNAETVSGDLAGVSAQMENLLSKDRVEAIDRLIVNLDLTVQDLRQTSATLQQLMKNSGDDLKAGMQEFRYTMETLSRHAEPVAQNLDSTMLNLQEFSRSIRQNPGTLLRNTETRDDPVPPLRAKE
jgi:phospholipid/cholesterol/gamma-HCH transport system substrate-binding protein